MKKKLKAFLLTLFFFVITCMLLTFPAKSLSLSLTGLQLWFNKMIPALLPFMIISGIMIRMNLTESFVRILSPLLTPLLRISPNGLYAVVVGFLCGFPMGAKVIADLYSQNRISKKEATFLLSFCNNIGPVYFISFVLPTLKLQEKTPYIFGMYGLPFLYGVFLRHTIYKKKDLKVSSYKKDTDSLALLDALDDSIMTGLGSIARLGGYMVLFNLLNLIPFVLSMKHGAVINCLLEITSGISRMGNTAPLTVLLLLPFGGLSCIAQTYSMIKETDLSLKNYVLHKMILTAVTAVYYGLFHLFSPSSFLL